VPIALEEVASPLAFESCHDSASNSTATPSEVASAIEEASPRNGETVFGAVKKLARPEMDVAPLDEMFADSDDEARVISPSKSARRRMRRQRQRDALRAASCYAQQVDGQQVFEPRHVDFQHATEPHLTGAMQRVPDERARARTTVTLDQLGFELGGNGAGAGETSQAYLVTTPAHSAPRTPAFFSTSPYAEIPPSPAESYTFRASPASDASTRPMPSTTPQPHKLGQQFWNASPCAERRVDGYNATGFVADASLSTSNVSSNQLLVPGSVVTSPCSPPSHPTVLASSNSTHGRVEAWMASPGEQVAADTIRVLFGSATTPAGGDIVATLQAAAPEVYED